MLNEIDEILKKDTRYKIQAYAFVLEALEVARRLVGKDKHVSGKELLEGIRVLAQKQYGIMAKTVFESWGIKTTDDFGEIVFNLVEVKLLSKTEEDSKEDFHNVFDFEEVFIKQYTFPKRNELKKIQQDE